MAKMTKAAARFERLYGSGATSRAMQGVDPEQLERRAAQGHVPTAAENAAAMKAVADMEARSKVARAEHLKAYDKAKAKEKTAADFTAREREAFRARDARKMAGGAGKDDPKGTREERKDTSITARGVKGMSNKPWEKTFKSPAAMNAWVDKNDAEVTGTLRKESDREADTKAADKEFADRLARTLRGDKPEDSMAKFTRENREDKLAARYNPGSGTSDYDQEIAEGAEAMRAEEEYLEGRAQADKKAFQDAVRKDELSYGDDHETLRQESRDQVARELREERAAKRAGAPDLAHLAKQNSMPAKVGSTAGGGGGGKNQPRVPQGNPTGGRWTK